MVHLFGIRHHGPGSARSLRRALETLEPDIVLVEGPPDAEEVLPLLSDPDMQPPVALLIYAPERPRDAVYYPFAVYSPEWQAIRYAQERKIPVRFMDLPQTYRFAAAAEAAEAAEALAKTQNETPTEDQSPTAAPEANLSEIEGAESETSAETESVLRRDPLQAIAEAAGYADGEDWWEQFVEHRADAADQFEGIVEIMGEMRAQMPPETDIEEQRREAWMRRTIRAAEKEGFQKIAVVCGAFHTPALAERNNTKEDDALLKGMPKVAVSSTWVPWTFGRLTARSGYGAGVRSPAWYQRLWESPERVPVRWLADAAALLRSEDLPASTASVIEAVRLAETLAALRGLPLAALPELREAALSILCNGYSEPMALIEERLIVGERMGSVAEKTPMLPLQLDLRREQKRLRLDVTADYKDIDLDLRKENDLERSQLLRRLILLGIPWGALTAQAGGKGTFRESWRLQWQPEFEVRLIEANIWGRTLYTAATELVRDQAQKATELPALTTLVESALQAHLPEALELLMETLENLAAVTSDIPHMMDALPPLANVLRYGTVRKTESTLVAPVVHGLLTRICIGLPAACGSLNDEAADAMYGRIMRVHQAVGLLQNSEEAAEWNAALVRLADREGLHGLIAGTCCRLLLDQEVWNADEVSRRLSLALSTASDPVIAAAWLEGMLRDYGEVLLHTDTLWSITDEWLTSLSGEVFVQLLPLLRRTFTTFSPALRRALGEQRVKAGRAGTTNTAARGGEAASELDTERARRPLPLVARLLGLTYEENGVK